MKIIYLIGLLCLSSCVFETVIIKKDDPATSAKNNITHKETEAAKYIMEPNADPVVIESLRKSLGQP